MMIVWMSAISNHFLGPVETFFNHFADFARMIYDAKIVLFNATFDFSYPFASVVLIGISIFCVQIVKLITKTEEKFHKLEQKYKLKEEILINKELENSYKMNNLSENKFIVKIILKENEDCKKISYEDSHLFIRRLVNLLKKHVQSLDYREKIKGVTLVFDHFDDIDKVITCIKYWNKNLLEADFTAVVLLDQENVQNSFNKIFNVATNGKIITDSMLKAKYNFLEEQHFKISSEGTFMINEAGIELFSFN
ncbi:hypothetical protein IJI31_01660 [bacterium]|nr:hypothetical protein [bacterium]